MITILLKKDKNFI